MTNVKLRGAHCESAVFTGEYIPPPLVPCSAYPELVAGALLAGCKADGAFFDDGATGISAVLKDLSGTSWRGCDLSRVVWQGQILQGACLEGGSLVGTVRCAMKPVNACGLLSLVSRPGLLLLSHCT
jgi:uncharacterized protein YjbI with pentapeptide repeats